MFVGHYAASLFARPFYKTAPLWWFFLAAQLTDIVWCILVLLHIEHPRLVAAGRGFAGLRLDAMPYSHSLAFTALWAAVALLAFRFLPRPRPVWGAAFVVAGVVVTHWFLDAVVHRRDLPVYDSVMFVGLKLWDKHPVIATVIELILLASAFAVYWFLAGGDKRAASRPVLWFAAFLVVVQIVMSVVPLRSVPPFSWPASDGSAARVLAGFSLGFYLLCVWWASKLEPANRRP